MSIKTTHNALAARLAAKSVGVTVLTLDATTPDKAPAPRAHKGVVILNQETVRGHPRRNLDTDRVQVSLTYQVTPDAESGMDAAMDLEQSILDALEDLAGDWDLAAAGLEGVHHERSVRGYHPRSTGWILIRIYLVVYRQAASTP